MLIGMLKRAARALGEHGREVLDGTPVAVPAGFKRPETLEEQIKRLIQSRDFGKAISGNDEAEDFDEANDFDIPDDPPDPASPHEEWFDPSLERNVTAHEAVSQHAQLTQEAERKDKRRKAPPAAEPPAEPPPAEKPAST